MLGIQIVKQIMASDLMSWFLAFIGGIIAYRVIDHMQTSIERHSVIKDVEKTINDIFSTPIAKSNKSDDSDSKVNVRTVLHDDSPWEIYLKGSTKIEIHDNQRYVQIRDTNDYQEFIGTQAVHELLILFRRIEKLYKDSIIKPIDLADMWREILPFGTSGRLEFFKSYLSEYDIQSIVFVLLNTILACKKYKIYNAINYFKSYYLEDMSQFFLNNSRYTIKEKLKVKIFINLMK